MFLHLGQETTVKTENIVGIYDLDTSTVSKWTREYLNLAEKEGRVVTVSYELPKSFVIYKEKNDEKETVFISPLSSQTLLRRLNQKNIIT